MSTPLLSIIVPTYNSAKNLESFLGSFLGSTYKNFEVIVNDDLRTNDDTESVIANFSNQFKLIYIRENTMMAQARKQGTTHANGDILIHLDSDMKVTPELLQECVDKITAGADALVIPEESHGTTFWAKCKWLEKKCYERNDHIESLRCVKTSIYRSLGGHDERMVFSEDKDFDLRVRAEGHKVDRTKNFLYHNEGNLQLIKTLKKKLGYSATANVFAETHPAAFKWQTNIFNRYLIYIKNFKYLFMHPLLYLGMIFMKTAEFAAGALGLVRAKMVAHT